MELVSTNYNSNLTELSTIYSRSKYENITTPRGRNSVIPELTIKSLINKTVPKELYLTYFPKKKKKVKISLKGFMNKQKENNENQNKYSLLMKKLESWDKENILIKNQDPSTLYKKLSSLYKKINLKKEQKKLDELNYLITSKTNYNKLMDKGKSNKILDDFFNKRNIAQGSILRNNIIKTKTRFSFSLFEPKNQKDIEQNIGVDSETINAMSAEEINNEYYNKVIKEKVKYEKQLHSELISLNNDIYDKKSEKISATKKLSKIYNNETKLTKDYNFNLNKKKLKLEKFKENFERKYNHQTLNKDTKKIYMIDSLEASKKNDELINNIKESEIKYKENMKTINIEKEICLDNMKRIEEEMIYYKQINDELILEQKQYYLDILKNGYDSRGEGMIWVVRNLLELQTNLEYHHFPKFLTHEEVDYLIKIATISLEEIQLKIIMKVLKNKHNELKTKENIRKMSLVENLFSDANLKRKKKNENNNNKIHRRIITDYEIQKARIKKEINKKFIKLYTRNEETMKMFVEKNVEDNKEQAFIENLRDCLFGRGSLDNSDNLLKIFQGDEQQKIIFKLILYIRKRINDLTFIKKKLIEEQINIFKEKNEKKENELNIKQLMQKELVKKCLFGSSENI